MICIYFILIFLFCQYNAAIFFLIFIKNKEKVCQNRHILGKLMHPTELVFYFAPLNARQRIVKRLRHLADFAAANEVFLVAVRKLADGRNDRRRTAPPRLFQRAVFQRGNEFVHGQKPFVDLIPHRL